MLKKNESVGRTALLHATIVVVGQGGLRSLTYREVAAEAGVSHGLVRHHFGSRDQLIAAAMDFAIEESLRQTNMINSALTADEFATGIETLATTDSDMQAFQYELLLESRRRPELQVFAERYYNAYRKAVFAQLRLLGVTDQGLCDLIWFTLDGIVFKQLVAPDDVQPALTLIRDLIKQAAH